MKRIAIPIILLMFATIFIPCATVVAQPAFTPHEDPTMVVSAIDPYSFLSEYATIFGLMAAQRYSDASRLSAELSHIAVPEDLSYIINRYNNLTQQLISVLNDLKVTLDKASSLLDQYRLSEAEVALEQAAVLVSKAQILLGDLKDATTTLIQRLGVLAAPAESKVRQAYDELQSMLDRLNDLINLYHILLQRANQTVDNIESQNLNPTELTFSLNSTECFVGGYLTASGVLTSNGQVLANRAIQLLIDDNSISTTKTNSDGYFQTNIQMPYKYVNSVNITALYTPLGADRGSYLATLSPTITVHVLFYNTIFDVSIPSVAYPGLSIDIQGTVASPDGTRLNGRQVTVKLDNTTLSRIITDQNGAFSTKPTISSQESLGTHNLTVSVAASGLYAQASIKRNITITKMATEIRVNAPSVILLPSEIQVTGRVSAASGALANASVGISFATVSTNAKTRGDGSFNVTLEIPLNTVFAGFQNLKFTVQPTEPWQATVQKNVSVFVLNSVGMVVALASSLSVVFVVYSKLLKNRSRKMDNRPFQTETPAQNTSAETPAIAAQPIPETKFVGVKGRVLQAYIGAYGAVQTATGSSLLANMTLREYMQATSLKAEEAAEPFSHLTALAEKSLYSPHEPTEEDAAEADALASKIRRSLNGIA
jgi:hypothetical protein